MLGACESFFEELIISGANFASSPGRILIDFIEPLIIAKKVAMSNEYNYITMTDIVKYLRNGYNGMGGVGAQGKMKCNITVI